MIPRLDQLLLFALNNILGSDHGFTVLSSPFQVLFHLTAPRLGLDRLRPRRFILFLAPLEKGQRATGMDNPRGEVLMELLDPGLFI